MGDFSDAFSEGLEKFFLSVKSAANTVAKKTKEGANYTKTSIQMQEEENKLKKLYTKLGIRTLLNEGVDSAWEQDLKDEYVPSREEIIREIQEHRARLLQYRANLHQNETARPSQEAARTVPVFEADSSVEEAPSFKENSSFEDGEYVAEPKTAARSFGEVIKPPMSDGVRIFNFCPACHCGNIPQVKKCIYCGYVLNEK